MESPCAPYEFYWLIFCQSLWLTRCQWGAQFMRGILFMGRIVIDEIEKIYISFSWKVEVTFMTNYDFLISMLCICAKGFLLEHSILFLSRTSFSGYKCGFSCILHCPESKKNGKCHMYCTSLLPLLYFRLAFFWVFVLFNTLMEII